MSALGDYVHLTTKNYIKYGVNPPHKGASSPYITIHNFIQERTKNLNQINQNTIDSLKLRIAADSATKEKRDALGTQNQYQQMLNDLWVEIGKYTSTDLLGWLQGEHDTGNTKWNQFKSTDYKTAKKSAFTHKDLNEKIRIRNQIIALINKINKQEVTSDKDLQTIVDLYNQLGLDKITDASSTLGKIQSVLTDLIYDNQINILAGDFGEHLVYAARDSANSKAQTTVDDFVEGIVGREQSDITFNRALVAVDLNEYDSQTFRYSDKYSESEYYLGHSQDKVDVKITVNGENLLASVKNYKDLSINDKVSLQKNMSILVSLLYLNQRYVNFGNHWLNMHVTTIDKAYNLINQNDINNADEILTQEMAYEALVSGNPLKTASLNSNIFIVIDRFSGKVFAKSTKELLLSDFNSFSINPDITTLRFSNQFASTYEDRIANVLLQLHKIKLNIGFHVKLT